MSRKRLQLCCIVCVLAICGSTFVVRESLKSDETVRSSPLEPGLTARATSTFADRPVINREKTPVASGVSHVQAFALKFLDSAKNKSIALWTLYQYSGDSHYLNALKDRLLHEPQAGYLLAIDSWKQGRSTEERLALLRKAHSAFPDDHMLGILLGVTESELGNHNHAFEAWTSAAASQGEGTGANERRQSMREFLIGIGTDEMVAWLEADRFETRTEEAVLPPLARFARELHASSRQPSRLSDKIYSNAAIMTAIAGKLDPGRAGIDIISVLADSIEAGSLRRLSPGSLIGNTGQTAAERINEIAKIQTENQRRIDRVAASKLLASPEIRRHFFEVKERAGGMAAVSYVEALMQK